MGKQQQSAKKTIGKGKVTPVQVAFIVDRYLSDNNFVQTRSSFRSEASHLISKSPVHEAPRSLLSLVDMLDEYISLKEHKVILNQEKTRLDHEKFRVQNLLRGMQNVMNSYNSSAPAPPPARSAAPPPPPLPSPMVTPLIATSATTTTSPAPPPAAASFPVYNTPAVMSTSCPLENATPSTSQVSVKRRRNSKDSGPPLAAASKRSRAQPSLKSTSTAKTVLPKPNSQESSILHITPPPTAKPTTVQGSSVAKCLFNPAPQTPSPSPIVETYSPVVDNQTPPSSNKKTVLTPQFTSTNRTVITSETIQVSPMKQVSYYSIERNHCISSPNKRFSKRDHVKGRLDFDGSEATAVVNSETLTSDENTGSPSEDDAFDFDLSNFDCLGADFNLTELLGDFDLGGFCQTDNGSSPESLSGSPDTMVDVDGTTGDHELVSGMSSTMTEFRSEQDMNTQGPNSVTSMKSITKCIKVFSPVKSRSQTGLDD